MPRPPAFCDLRGDLFSEAAHAGGDPSRGIGLHELGKVLAQRRCATRLGDHDWPVGAVVERVGRVRQPLSGLRQLTRGDPRQPTTQVGAAGNGMAGVFDHTAGRCSYLRAETLGKGVDDQHDVAVPRTCTEQPFQPAARGERWKCARSGQPAHLEHH